jgi:hypothetical protein
MFQKKTTPYGKIYYENDQCTAWPDPDRKVILLPFFLGYGKGVIPKSDGGYRAKEMLNWLVQETGIRKFILTSVLAPDEYVEKLNGVIVPQNVEYQSSPDPQVHFTWRPPECA